MNSLRGARQHLLPKSYSCAKIQDCYVRKSVFLLFSSDIWDLLENWKYEEARCNPYYPAAAAMLLQYLAVLEQCACVSCQKPSSKGTLTTEYARYIPLVIPWPSFLDLKKDAIRDGRTSAGSLGMFFKLRQLNDPTASLFLLCICVKGTSRAAGAAILFSKYLHYTTLVVQPWDPVRIDRSFR